MSDEREWGVGGGEWEPKSSTGAPAPTPHTPLPTPNEPNWRLIYTAVLGELTILIIIFYAFTKAFA
ncbi:MAG TPA: hypothetical protein VGQ65_05020 [Thermoanaerobaculia bacterium]|jgi:hypothetical protein|nr:hypothetical protein [Thermoanaerobaculia bacterium]